MSVKVGEILTIVKSENKYSHCYKPGQVVVVERVGEAGDLEVLGKGGDDDGIHQTITLNDVQVTTTQSASDVRVTLTERNHTHGDYHEQAELSGVLKDLIRGKDNWRKLTYGQKEALEMIAVKISRILNGNPHHQDSWHDIAGYASLAERECQNGCRS